MIDLEKSEQALEKAAYRAELGAFWALEQDLGLADAEQLDQAVCQATAGALAGLPFAVKDLFDQRGLPTTAGLIGDFPVAQQDAAAVAALRRAGAVPIGKTAMDQLGCTTGGQAMGFPACLNPLDAGWSPGGSSSGSAVAVAAGIVPFALGTDTAGSCRIPAAYCGVVGFKPASGAIATDGVIPVMPGFDQLGLLARDVATCERAYGAILAAGPGPKRPQQASASAPTGPLRIGLLSDHLAESDAAVAAAVTAHLEGAVEQSGPRLRVESVALDWEGRGFGALLARSLALTWGERIEREPERFNQTVSETVEFGRSCDADKDREIRDRIGSQALELARRLSGFDLLAGPAVPIPTPDREDENVATSSRFTRLFNALGWPAIVVPARSEAGARPVGTQLVSPSGRVDPLFAAAGLLEQA